MRKLGLAVAFLATLACIETGLAQGTQAPNYPALRAETMDQLYEAAKKEGALVIYGGGPSIWYEPWAKEFEQAFPGIRVTTRVDSSNVLDQAIDKQIKENNLQVDVAVLQTVQDYERWKSERVLVPFKPSGFEKIDDAWKDKDGAYVGVNVNGLSYGYNPMKMSIASMPKSAPDFLKPEFGGKIITTYPYLDDVTLYLYQNIVDMYGLDFLDKLKLNQPSFVQGHIGVARAISSGERTLTFDGLISIMLGEANRTKTVEIMLSDHDPIPVYAQIGAIFRNAPHPNAAKLYLSWYLEPDQQKRQLTWSSRSDVAPPVPLKPLSSYRTANHFREFIMDEARVKALRDRYLEFTGPATAAGVSR